MNVKTLIKNNPVLVNILSFIYNMIFSNCRIALITGLVKADGCLLKGTKIKISGKNNKLQIGRYSRIFNSRIIINGNNCVLSVGGGTFINNTVLYEEDDGCLIGIGDHFSMEGGHIASTEGEKILIGEDCMFSGDVEIRNGDSHVIVEHGTTKRINKASTVRIGNHVWLAAHVRVLKGSTIADNCIIGNSSIVSSILNDSNCIYGGVPAKLLKKEVDWFRDRRKPWD